MMHIPSKEDLEAMSDKEVVVGLISAAKDSMEWDNREELVAYRDEVLRRLARNKGSKALVDLLIYGDD